jgi:hypothetical protein
MKRRRRIQITSKQMNNLVEPLYALNDKPLGEHPPAEECVNYLMDMLTPQETEEIDQHLATCPDCVARMDHLAAEFDKWCGNQGNNRLASLRRRLLGICVPDPSSKPLVERDAAAKMMIRSTRDASPSARPNKPVIKIIGVGGAGGNAINKMIELGLNGVEFVAVNTDAQDLGKCEAQRKLRIGENITRGLGTGFDPELGRQAAEADQDDLRKTVEGADMVFITAGLGGGTGTGASPVIAKMARNVSALTLAVVTQPFCFDG